MNDFIVLTLTTYAITFLVVSSAMLAPIRIWLVNHTKFLIVAGSHPLICRMCFGLWASIAVCMVQGEHSIGKILAIYGASYFMATLEGRK